ncbi:SDR family NAD(P)-dependent oxidoreductase [Pseudonocardia alni]|uniref:SDR family NAD(P)-dependent oxidoreductase n=1 Tax=Pseudonocardia alni TaxID=33907 RepID=UPI0033329C05
MDISGTSAVVAGGASGLGLATAAMLVDVGASVVVADLDTPAKRAAAEAVGATFVPADITTEPAVRTVVGTAAERGPLRIVVNCAGIGTPHRVLGRSGVHPLELFDQVLRVNLTGTFNVIRLCAAEMARTGAVGGERGVIVNTASVASFDGQVGQAAYAASKGGVAAMTLPLARDLAGAQIRVVAVAPGMFRTPLLAGLPADAIASLGRQVPHPARVGEPQEFAALVRHIVENPMLNGEVIRLDGAIRMAPR